MSVLTAVASDSLSFIDGPDGNGGIQISYYGSVNEADSWFQQRLYNRPWTSSSRQRKIAALVEATMLINNLRFAGEKTDEDQPNEFPRDGDTDVPLAIRRATYELALPLLDGQDVEKEIRGHNIIAQGFAGARMENNVSSPQEHTRNGILSFIAWQMLVPYLADPNAITMRRVT